MTRPGEAASSQVRCVGLVEQLVRLDERQLGEAAEVRLEAPDALLGVEHRVVVAEWALELDGRQWATTSSPGCHTCTPGPVRRTTPDKVRAEHVVRQVVALGER